MGGSVILRFVEDRLDIGSWGELRWFAKRQSLSYRSSRGYRQLSAGRRVMSIGGGPSWTFMLGAWFC